MQKEPLSEVPPELVAKHNEETFLSKEAPPRVVKIRQITTKRTTHYEWELWRVYPLERQARGTKNTKSAAMEAATQYDMKQKIEESNVS